MNTIANDRRSFLKRAGRSLGAAGVVATGLSARQVHAAHHEVVTQTEATQAAMTPQKALGDS